MSGFTVFDIETGPLPDDEIRKIAPPFDPESVRTGNMGIEKSAEKIDGVRRNYFNGIKRKAALHAEYGRVLAIGWESDGNTVVQIADEKTMLKNFWDASDETHHAQGKWVGFNVFHFDLPFLIRRSIINGVTVPRGLQPKNNRYYPDFWVDLMQCWQAGDYRETISLDRFAKALGHGGKNGSGSAFAETLKNDESAAIAYLENDLLLTRQVATACFNVF